jgi:hypothetical protein
MCNLFVDPLGSHLCAPSIFFGVHNGAQPPLGTRLILS